MQKERPSDQIAKNNASGRRFLFLCSFLLVFESLSGYALFFIRDWTAYKQTLVLVHLFLGLPLIPAFARFTSIHLSKTIRKKRAGRSLLLLTALGTLFFVVLNNFNVTRIGKYVAILIYFLSFTDRTIVLYTLAGAVLFNAIINLPSPLFSQVVNRGETLDLLLFTMLWISYLWRPIRKKESLVQRKGQNFHGVASSVSVGILLYTGLILFLGLAIYSGGRAAAAFHRVAGLIVPFALTAHVLYFLGLRFKGDWVRVLRVHGKHWAAVGGACALGLAAVWAGSRRFDADGYINAVYPGYRSSFNNPLFGPAETKTSVDSLLDKNLISNSQSCGATRKCHGAVIEQWEDSAHRYSASTPVFTVLLEVMRSEKGDEAARFCAGCHMPIDLLSGNLNPGRSPDPKAMEEGIGCLVCHSTDRVEAGKGNGAFRLLVQKQSIIPTYGVYPDGRHGPKAWLHDLLLKNTPERHVDLYNRPVLKDAEFCSACHIQFVHEELNGVGTVSLQNQYSSWESGPYNHPSNGEKPVRCQDCHMPLLEANLYQAPIRDHRFLAANYYTPILYEKEKQKDFTLLYLKGETDEIVERSPIEGYETGFAELKPFPSPERWARGPVLSMTFESLPASARPGETIDAVVRTVNARVGHDFPQGPLDLIDVWMEVRIADAAGRTLWSLGGLDGSGRVKADSPRLGGVEVDENGKPVEYHKIWLMREVANERRIPPRKHVDDRLTISLPRHIKGPATLRASWHYRNPNQQVIEVIASLADVPERARKVPDVELAFVETGLNIAP